VSTSVLVGPRTLRATIGDLAFPAAAASVWNSLSESVRASSSLPVFRGILKTELIPLDKLRDFGPLFWRSAVPGSTSILTLALTL